MSILEEVYMSTLKAECLRDVGFTRFRFTWRREEKVTFDREVSQHISLIAILETGKHVSLTLINTKLLFLYL